MESKLFQFSYSSEPGKVASMVLNLDELSTIETVEYAENNNIGDPNAIIIYAIVFYTKNINLLGKKSNRIVFPFETEKERDETFESMLSILSPTRFDVKYIVY